LVAFVGGGGGRSGWNLSIGSSPGIAWYPLAPGEAWRPSYRTSPVYVRNVNRNIVVNNNSPDAGHLHRRRGEALTAVRVEDFSRGLPVHSHWTRVNPAEIARAPVGTPLSMPEPRRFGDGHAARARTQPPAQFPAPVIAGRQQPQFVAPGFERPGDRSRTVVVPREDSRLQQQERGRRDQQVQQERFQREQQLSAQRQQEEQRRAQQAQVQHEHALRQQAAQERAQRQQELQQQRAMQQQQRAAQQQELQQQRAIQQQQHAAQLQELQQQRARQQQQAQIAAPAAVPPAAPRRGEGRERAAERGRQAQDWREERRSQGEDEGQSRGRGRGYGRGG
jgi:hypothetical protein